MDLGKGSVNRDNSGGCPGAVAGGRTPLVLLTWWAGVPDASATLTRRGTYGRPRLLTVVTSQAGSSASGARIGPRSDIEAGCIASFLFLTLQPDLGMTQSRIVSRLRGKCFSLEFMIESIQVFEILLES